MKVSRFLLAGVLLALAVPVGAQSLGDLAKKEQERRKAAPPAAKVYTNEDLKKISVPAASSTAETSPSTNAADAKGATDAKDSKDPKAKDAGDDKAAPAMDEAAWHARMTQAREDVRRGEMFRDALQSRINGLTADFTAHDDPYQRAQIADERQKALAELARVNTDIDTARKQIDQIEEDARKANVPPGWIR